MIESAAPLASTPWTGYAVALALAIVAMQPPYLALLWRDIQRSGREGVAGGHVARVAALRPGTAGMALLIGAIFVAIAGATRPLGPWPLLAGVAAVLLLLALLDHRFFWLPDRITLPFAVAGLAAALPDRDLLLEGLVAAVLAGGMVYAVHLGFRLLRGFDGLGLGDVKLIAGLGAWVGVEAMPWLVLTACLTALSSAALHLTVGLRTTAAAQDRGGRLRSPFGLHLAMAAWLFICLRQAGAVAS